MSKNTRILYNDSEHIEMYRAIPPEQFKSFILAIMEYKYGDDDFVNTIQDPMVKALFLSEKPNIDRNEEKWERKAQANRENGKNGGRPKKTSSDLQDLVEDNGKVYTKDEVYNSCAVFLRETQKEKGDKEMFNELDWCCSHYGLDRKELMTRKNRIE